MILGDETNFHLVVRLGKGDFFIIHSILNVMIMNILVFPTNRKKSLTKSLIIIKYCSYLTQDFFLFLCTSRTFLHEFFAQISSSIIFINTILTDWEQRSFTPTSSILYRPFLLLPFSTHFVYFLL